MINVTPPPQMHPARGTTPTATNFVPQQPKKKAQQRLVMRSPVADASAPLPNAPAHRQFWQPGALSCRRTRLLDALCEF